MPNAVPHERPHLQLPAFVPPPRFGATSFETYQPQHPSQQAALARVRAFAAETAPTKAGFRWPWQSRHAPGRGLYLDGGFGVGKTHLLAATYHASAVQDKAYLSFQELVYAIGVLGMDRANRELAYQLYCIDEFELDDPGNTLIVKTFLAHAFARGALVLTTSNTPPEAQGQGRFNAEDFRREIQSIAQHFEMLRIEGPDYRRRDHLAGLLSDTELAERARHELAPEPKHLLGWPGLFELLEAHHPIHYAGILRPIGTLYLQGARPIPDQNGALRFVHFIDKLYDLGVGLRLSGDIDLQDLFDPSYRRSAYAKKHDRCLSRLSELLEERFPAENAGPAD